MAIDILHFQKTGRYKQAVKGESNYQEHLERAAEETDLEVDLFLEDHNKFDKNAVAIVFETDTVGYLSREDAVKYRAAIKALGHPQAIGTCAAKVTGGGEGRSYGIVLDLDINNLVIVNISHTTVDMPQPTMKPISSTPKVVSKSKDTNKIPFIPIKGKGCLFFFVVLPLIAIVNFYILLFWLISKGIQWLWKIATATPQSKKILLIAVGSLSALWIVSALISALLQAVGITSPATPAPTVDTKAIQNTAIAEAWLSYTQTAAAFPTNTSLPTATLAPLPTQTLAPIATVTATTFLSILPINQTATQVSTVQEAVCACSGDTLNCGDFTYHSSAQSCFDYCMSQGVGDIHGLDSDGNNSACESLP